MAKELGEKDRARILQKVGKACQEYRKTEDDYYLQQVPNENVVPIFGKKHNLLGLPTSKKYGGLGADVVTHTLALERIAQEGLSLRTFHSVHAALGQETLERWGTEEQKRKHLPLAASGRKIMAFALTEPEAGSDPASLQATYEKKRGSFVLNGEKAWISNGSIADVVLSFARDKKTGKISAFILERGFEGYSTERITHKMGLHSIDTGRIYFNNCVVPEENLLGVEGKGLSIAFSAIQNGRLGVAAGGVGVMQDCLDEAARYARHRQQHHKLIGKHQLVQGHLAHISVSLEAAKSLVLHAARKQQAFIESPRGEELREDADSLIARAKYFATNASFDAADRAVQVFGAKGFSLENRCARHFVDSRATRIYEGTNEVLELKIARSVLGKGFDAFK